MYLTLLNNVAFLIFPKERKIQFYLKLENYILANAHSYLDLA